MPVKAKELGPLAISRINMPGLHAVGGVPGLALQVLPSGAKTWILRATIGGKRRDMGLGGYSASGVGVAEARKRALLARDKITAGIDPIDEAKRLRSELTASQLAMKSFTQCAYAYIEAHEPSWKNAKHAQQWRTTLEQYAYPVMGKLLVRHIGQTHVLEVLTPIWTTKTETATRLRSRIELVLDWATARGYREGANPARWRGHLDMLLAKPTKIAKVKHFEALPVSEVGQFMQALREQEGIGALTLEFAILTAARSGEVRNALWREISLDEAVWTIPAHKMKANKEHRVPLSPAALKLLKRLPVFAGSELIFPSARNKALSDMTLTAVLRRMGTKAVPHGFRSTFRDWVSERTNYPRDVAEMALAHAIGDKVEAAYRRGDLFEKRRKMMNDWAAFIAKAELTTGAKVVPIRRKVK